MKRSLGPATILTIVVIALVVPGQLFAQKEKQHDTIPAFKKTVKFVGFTPDGKSLIACGIDEVPDPGRPRGTMADQVVTKLWDLSTRKSVVLARSTNVELGPNTDSLTQNRELAELAPGTVIHGDAKRLVFYLPRQATQTIVYDFATGKAKALVGVSPDGKAQTDGHQLKYLAVPYDASKIVKTIALESSGPTTFNQAATFSLDSKTLVVRDKDQNLVLWDVSSGKKTATLPNSNGRWYVFSPDGKTLVALGVTKHVASPDETNGFELFDVASGKRIATLQPRPNPSTGQPSFSPDSKSLAFGYSALEIYSAKSGKRTKVLQYPGKAIGPDLIFSPDGHTIAANCRDGSLKLWSVASGKITGSLQLGSCLPAFSPGGQTLACGYEDGSIVLLGSANAAGRR